MLTPFCQTKWLQTHTHTQTRKQVSADYVLIMLTRSRLSIETALQLTAAFSGTAKREFQGCPESFPPLILVKAQVGKLLHAFIPTTSYQSLITNAYDLSLNLKL